MAHAKRFSPTTLWIAVAAVIIVAVVLLAPQTGLLGNGKKAGNGTPPPPPPVAAAEPPGPMPVTVTVTVKDFAFDPVFVEVPSGSTVIWAYPEGRSKHQIVLRDLNNRSPTLSPGQDWAYTFTTPGSYLVLDAVYKSMQGRVNVTG